MHRARALNLIRTWPREALREFYGKRLAASLRRHDPDQVQGVHSQRARRAPPASDVDISGALGRVKIEFHWHTAPAM